MLRLFIGIKRSLRNTIHQIPTTLTIPVEIPIHVKLSRTMDKIMLGFESDRFAANNHCQVIAWLVHDGFLNDRSNLHSKSILAYTGVSALFSEYS